MIWLSLAILIEIAGTLGLRMLAVHGQKAWVAWVVVAYVSSYVFLSLALRQGIPLGVAYGIWTACGVALTALLSFLLFREPFTWLKGLGVALIIGGVLLVDMG